MPDINIGQQGHKGDKALKSMPKLTKINGDDAIKVIYRNLGNNHAYPFIWADTVTLASGSTTTVVASGVKFHGMKLADYASVVITPQSNPGSYLWIDKNTSTNVISVKSSAALSSAINVSMMFMLGTDATKKFIDDLACRGNTGAQQNLP